MRACLILGLLAILSIKGFSQPDLTIGSAYQLNLQRQGSNGDAFILHNSQFSSGYQTMAWTTTHGSMGSRGIRFSYTDGIHFYADNQPSTAGGTFTPVSRFFIGNTGYLGVGTTAPRGHFDVDGPGDIYLADDVNTGTAQSIFLPGHIYIAPYLGGNVSYIQARRFNDTGSNAMQFRTMNNGSLVEALQIQPNGMIGIGITSPTYKLQVNGLGNTTVDVRVNGRIQTGDAANQGGVYLNTAGNMLVGQFDPTKVGLYNAAWRLIIDNTGKVGIGTSTPDEMLTVNGKINSEEIIVSPSVPAPDYVFEKNYDLPSLDEVHAYITQHKHLPEVPSAKEMETNGVKVGEMEMILLKKIEELTLYLLKQQNQLDAQQKEIQDLKKASNN